MKYFMMAAMLMACGDKEDSSEPKEEEVTVEQEVEDSAQAE